MLYIYYLRQDLRLSIVLPLLKGHPIKISQPKYLKGYSLLAVIYRPEIYIEEY
jgi:hypothetical protein